MNINEIIENFGYLDDWEDRYRYLIELGRDLPALSEEERSVHNKVKGCASQVWLVTQTYRDANGIHIDLKGDSDAHIVKGLVAIVLALYSKRTAKSIGEIDEKLVFMKLGLNEHLTPQRSNGLASMVARIKNDAAHLTELMPYSTHSS